MSCGSRCCFALVIAIGYFSTGACLSPDSGGSAGGKGGGAAGRAAGGSSGGASGGQSGSSTEGKGGASGSGGRPGTGGIGLGAAGAGGAAGVGGETGGVSGSGGTTHGGGSAGRSSGGSAGRTSGGGGSGDGGTGGQGDPGNGPTTITGLKIEDNPKNVLSAFVSWTTDKPGNSVVQFGQGNYEWEISDSALVTSHKVLIIGMVAGKAYQIKAMSSAGGTPASATGSYTTKALPSQIPVGKVTVNDTTKSQPGWTLMNAIKCSGTTPISDYPAIAVMYDATGQPVWYYIDGTAKDFGGATSTYLTDKGVLVGPVASSGSAGGESPREVDFAGNTLWECKDPLCGGSGMVTHDAIKLSNGNHVIVRWVTAGGGGMMGGDTTPMFEEIDASGKVVWTLDYGKLVPKPSGSSGDWCHGNSITIDIAKDAVYANCRFMGLVKTTYKNPGSLAWHMAASYGKAAGSMKFSPTTSQYVDTHDPEIHDDGTILFFDNGGYSTSMVPGGSTTTYHSRAVEYKIDEAQKTATLVWEFPGTFNVDAWYKNNWYNAYFGDADRLANGNVLIAAGSLGSKNGDARVFEVAKADGKVVWELQFDAGIGFYRAERITPPLVHAISK